MRICVVGGGYVGLVSSVCFAELGHFVNLIEIDENKSKAINSGMPPIYENGLKDLLSVHVGRNLHASTDYDGISGSDMSIICVGTPSSADKRLDLSMVASASESLGKSLNDGGSEKDRNAYHVVVVKSTVPPGTTEEIVIPAVLRYSGRKPDEIGFAMNPEFLREGLAVQDFMNPDRIIIGSQDKRAGDLVESAYQRINSPIIRTGIKSAEMTKYASNAFLAAKISFANEIGNVCKRLGIDVHEVMQGVGMDSRIGPRFLNAGVGFGGSCFPKDVAALIKLAQDLGEDPVLLSSVMVVNDRQPARMVELLQSRIGELEGKRVAVLGLAFKDGTDDVRESRAIPVIRALREGRAHVAAYDPMASEGMERIFPDIEYCQSAADALRGADACLVMTEWPEFSKLDKEFELMHSRIIIEGRRMLSCQDKEGICW
jgi:UDPglucose 6-dehydrogenase